MQLFNAISLIFAVLLDSFPNIELTPGIPDITRVVFKAGFH